MSQCNNCSFWQIPRGFQRASDYAATSTRLEEAIQENVLEMIYNDNFEGSSASNQKWPTNFVSATFKCTKCNKTFNLEIDVDSCRGGFNANP
jgi:transposase-like protein